MVVFGRYFAELQRAAVAVEQGGEAGKPREAARTQSRSQAVVEAVVVLKDRLFRGIDDVRRRSPRGTLVVEDNMVVDEARGGRRAGAADPGCGTLGSAAKARSDGP